MMIKPFEPETDIVLTAAEVREFDSWAINTVGIAGVVLMENAGRSTSELASAHLTESGGRRVCIFCGTGNNGGDGFVIARHLTNFGYLVEIVICGDVSKIKGDALINYRVVQKMGLSITALDTKDEASAFRAGRFASDSDLVIDAIFGTGLSGPLRSGYAEIVESVNSSAVDVISVDIPSGLDCDTGAADGAVIKAVMTVTFAAAKKGFTNPSSADYTGRVFVSSIGIERQVNEE